MNRPTPEANHWYHSSAAPAHVTHYPFCLANLSRPRWSVEYIHGARSVNAFWDRGQLVATAAFAIINAPRAKPSGGVSLPHGLSFVWRPSASSHNSTRLNISRDYRRRHMMRSRCPRAWNKRSPQFGPVVRVRRGLIELPCPCCEAGNTATLRSGQFCRHRRRRFLLIKIAGDEWTTVATSRQLAYFATATITRERLEVVTHVLTVSRDLDSTISSI